MSLDEWRIRLRTDPRGTVAELLEGFAERRSESSEVEDFFWRVLADQGTMPELVRALLGRLRAPGVDEPEVGLELGAREPLAGGELLDLDREHRVRVRGRLRMVATDLLAGFIRDPEAREAIATDPMRLPETVFVHRRRWSEAAALFALEHDHLTPRGRTPDLLARASLRYALARALFRVEDQAERAIRVMESALDITGSAATEPRDAETWRPFAARLAFHAREWLGFRHSEAGRYAEAEREFRAAAEAAPETDLAVAARTFAANALIRDGRPGDARELMEGFEPGSVEMSDDVSERWEELRRRLIEETGEDDPEG